MTSDQLGQVFERFYKADPSRAGGGSGLGLAIALENARLLGGGIDSWSEIGVGSVFRLRLPVARPLPSSAGADAGASVRWSAMTASRENSNQCATACPPGMRSPLVVVGWSRLDGSGGAKSA